MSLLQPLVIYVVHNVHCNYFEMYMAQKSHCNYLETYTQCGINPVVPVIFVSVGIVVTRKLWWCNLSIWELEVWLGVKANLAYIKTLTE